ncbi:hypothetical protein PTE30175_01098 [Pandoraea terrae]|uniref:DUF1116 domain-containing protein n=1 Tax=Pandoraea terrae TaxID=1537710 RepID=A0A5E4T1N1_9BURK|nr:DUF1116 domain-containing protein [Pandoraea terrae]VVD81705.1 hypothetical protein PTE30175_01098 [Pandoraea terrae]
MANSLLNDKISVVNVGVEGFLHSVTDHGGAALHLDWRPAGDGDPALSWAVAGIAADADDADAPGARVDAANARAAQQMILAQPMLVDIALHARDVWPEMGRTLLHAGAPVAWERMCGPMQGAMIGALLYEGWAKSADTARAMLASGEIAFASCHDWQAVGPMSGIISPSMPLFVVRNATDGNVAYTNMSEGIGRVLRFGANSEEVLDRLRWIERVLAPGLKVAVNAIDGGIELKPIQSQALLMGDEVHSRNSAATLLFFAAIAVPLIESDFDRAGVREILNFVGNTSQFFLNLSMASCKATMDAAHGIEGSSIVTAMARNGVTTAIRVSGLGARWFEAPSDKPVGLYFPGFSGDDANSDLGDSAITETTGFGGFSLAASPALVQLVGGTVTEAVSYSQEMYDITHTRNPAMSLPLLDFLGAPTGIDIRRVVETGIRPVITTGIAHREAGVGQIGAGIVRAPMGCFSAAAMALAQSYGVA